MFSRICSSLVNICEHVFEMGPKLISFGSRRAHCMAPAPTMTFTTVHAAADRRVAGIHGRRNSTAQVAKAQAAATARVICTAHGALTASMIVAALEVATAHVLAWLRRTWERRSLLAAPLVMAAALAIVARVIAGHGIAAACGIAAARGVAVVRGIAAA